LNKTEQNLRSTVSKLVIFVTGIKWHKRRKILTPTFHFNILKQFVEILIEEGNHMTKFLKDTKGSVDDLVSFISHHTLNAICGKMIYICVYVYVCVCVCACVRACVCVCV